MHLLPACDVYDSSAGICRLCLDVWYFYDIWHIYDASQLSQGLESHWTKGLIHIYLDLFTTGFAGKGPPALLASSPWGVMLKPWDVCVPPLGMASLCWLRLVRHLIQQELCFLHCNDILWRHNWVALFFTACIILGWDSPCLCPSVTPSAGFTSVLFRVRQIQGRFQDEGWFRVQFSHSAS